ncbi:hypothetical protein AOT92_10305 [Mycobacteroides sp. H101]|nr:hypothetical protein AOT92_10305 [Mycobacteroides sp. H101]
MQPGLDDVALFIDLRRNRIHTPGGGRPPGAAVLLRRLALAHPEHLGVGVERRPLRGRIELAVDLHPQQGSDAGIGVVRDRPGDLGASVNVRGALAIDQLSQRHAVQLVRVSAGGDELTADALEVDGLVGQIQRLHDRHAVLVARLRVPRPGPS